jgi:hypothetical protein
MAARLGVQPTSQWKKGDRRHHGKVHAASGFSVTVADAASPGELERVIQTFLEQRRDLGISFSQETLAAELSIGFTVGDSEQYVAGLDLSPGYLAVLADCGITLSITAYPTSDEANAHSAI